MHELTACIRTHVSPTTQCGLFRSSACTIRMAGCPPTVPIVWQYLSNQASCQVTAEPSWCLRRKPRCKIQSEPHGGQQPYMREVQCICLAHHPPTPIIAKLQSSSGERQQWHQSWAHLHAPVSKLKSEIWHALAFTLSIVPVALTCEKAQQHPRSASRQAWEERGTSHVERLRQAQR